MTHLKLLPDSLPLALSQDALVPVAPVAPAEILP